MKLSAQAKKAVKDSIKQRYRELLQHMLGAGDRYKKKQWGFRNHFVASVNSTDDFELQEMETLGLVKSGERLGQRVYWATKDGAIAIGFKPYQLRATDLAK